MALKKLKILPKMQFSEYQEIRTFEEQAKVFLQGLRQAVSQ